MDIKVRSKLQQDYLKLDFITVVLYSKNYLPVEIKHDLNDNNKSDSNNNERSDPNSINEDVYELKWKKICQERKIHLYNGTKRTLIDQLETFNY